MKCDSFPKNKKVLFIHIAFPSQFHLYLPKLLERGYDVSAITFKDDVQRKIPDEVKVHRLKPQEDVDPNAISAVFPGAKPVLTVHMLQKYRYAVAVYNFINKLKREENYEPDLVVSHEYSFFSYFIKTVWPTCKLICRMDLFHDPTIGMSQTSEEDLALTTFEKEHYDIVGKIWNMIALAAINEADRVFCATEYEKSTFPKHLHDRIDVIFDGINTNLIAPSHTVPPHPTFKFLDSAEFVIFATRSLEPLRGIGEFMRSIPYVLEKYPNMVFLIVGNSKKSSYGNNPRSGKTWMEIYKEKIYIPEQNLFQIEFIKHEYLNDLRLKAKVNVYLTYDWVLSWSLVETMSLACPIVANDAEPVREFIKDGENGRLVNIKDPESIANGIIEALENRDKFLEYGKKARELIVNNYRGELMSDKFMKLIENEKSTIPHSF